MPFGASAPRNWMLQAKTDLLAGSTPCAWATSGSYRHRMEGFLQAFRRSTSSVVGNTRPLQQLLTARHCSGAGRSWGCKVSANWKNASGAQMYGSEKCKSRFETETFQPSTISSCTGVRQLSLEVGYAMALPAAIRVVVILQARTRLHPTGILQRERKADETMETCIQKHECAICRQERSSKARVAVGSDFEQQQ